MICNLSTAVALRIHGQDYRIDNGSLRTTPDGCYEFEGSPVARTHIFRQDDVRGMLGVNPDVENANPPTEDTLNEV
ncbi:hypothetical protein LCGC14_1143130 [marine sediment metagenome]|uniref:Uncharacterized protein n=1 Tax=marine sediment metagenome TaxID=412755 RepID=A0A0F9PFV8_9ZZZZ